MLVRDPVDETSSGRQYINTTIALDVMTEDSTRSIADNFIKVMAHPSLLGCLSVGTYVGELYHIASGANGAAALDFIAKYCNGLLSSYERTPKIHTLKNIEASLQRTSSLVGELLRRRQLAALQDGLTELFVAMDGVVDLLNTPEMASDNGFGGQSQDDPQKVPTASLRASGSETSRHSPDAEQLAADTPRSEPEPAPSDKADNAAGSALAALHIIVPGPGLQLLGENADGAQEAPPSMTPISFPISSEDSRPSSEDNR
ncbi:hypothetical protein GGTG_13691 [Gaeumannomyces tritici R3-111a-1]|uniref:Uncharacterized protein n=1 Tax=Gaeumannomyces tritici (strain R3-111a-1) TaxID=644352 RepID=J3PJK5_GAET3|nr:hypothetical protein GGTG_13691 [Gaeumannomyces tritici R3-111a-1]EJT68739.1 hypothetical protein GGTG_13691 [Gaeumannomyces tritici R3-111a-1]